MRALFPGDIVLARAVSTNPRGKREGVVAEILTRNTWQVVGRYFEEPGIAFVQPDNQDITLDVVIPPGEQGEAKHGQFVMAEITHQPTARRQPTGRILEVMGDHLSPGMEIDVALRTHALPHQWPAEVTTELQHFKPEVSAKDCQGRTDIRDLPLVTIDGVDAKDFDDAVYCEAKPKGGWRLVVAIADVSHYVKVDTALDKEAYTRGNSVYFPGRVIPMLPEMLSNELCSLKPHVDRLCMVCDMRVSAKGKLTRYTLYDAVMRSRARLTYDEVSQMLTQKKYQPCTITPFKRLTGFI